VTHSFFNFFISLKSRFRSLIEIKVTPAIPPSKKNFFETRLTKLHRVEIESILPVLVDLGLEVLPKQEDPEQMPLDYH